MRQIQIKVKLHKLLLKACGLLAVAMVWIGLTPSMALASEAAARTEWQWRDGIHGAHPSYVEQLAGGNLLLVMNGYQHSQVLEVTKDGAIVWRHEKIQANSAVRLANGNTLITDSGAPGKPNVPRVIEVNPSGEIVWEHKLSSRAQAPTYATQLVNGDYLVATRDRVFQLNRQGQQLWTISKDNLRNSSLPAGEKIQLWQLVKAQELDNGNILLVDQGIRQNGQVLEVTKQGQVVASYPGLIKPVDALRLADGSTMVLDFAHFQVQIFNRQQQLIEVVDYRAVISQLSVLNQWRGQLLPNKHFLVSMSFTNGQSIVMQINDREPKVLLNGQEFLTSGKPMSIENRMMIPMRETLNALGATLNYNSETKSGEATRGDRTIIFSMDSPRLLVNGQEIMLPIAPRLVGNNAYIPLRLLEDGFGVRIIWQGETRTADIITN